MGRFRDSRGAKATACGFILLILGGQFWLSLHAFGGTTPRWLEAQAVGGLFLVTTGGLSMLAQWLATVLDG